MLSNIEKIDTILLDIPTVRPHVLAMATLRKQTIVLVRISFSDGTVGYGEATPIGGLSYGDESPEGIKLVIDTYIAPLIVNRELESVALVMEQIDSNIVGNRFARCAIETALFDALGKHLGVPVTTLLGGQLRSRLSVIWALASGNVLKDIAEAESMVAEKRHNIFKIKIGKRDLKDDIQHVADVKKALGDEVSIRVDVNQHWTRTQAKRGTAMLADAGIDIVEQPLRGEDMPGCNELTRWSRVPVMADEMVMGARTAYDIASTGAADVLSIKIAQSGGLLKAQQVAHIAATAGLGLYGGTMLESSIGTAASAMVFATLPYLDWGTELFGPLLLSEQILSNPLRYEDFHLQVPAGPGLGIEPDLDKIEFFSRSKESLRNC